MEPNKKSVTERGRINNCDYLISITEQDSGLFFGTAICLCKPLHGNFTDSDYTVVYVRCIEWLSDNCKN